MIVISGQWFISNFTHELSRLKSPPFISYSARELVDSRVAPFLTLGGRGTVGAPEGGGSGGRGAGGGRGGLCRARGRYKRRRTRRRRRWRTRRRITKMR